MTEFVVDKWYDGRPVLGHEEVIEEGVKVIYYKHITPSGDRWMLGKYLPFDDYYGTLCECLGQDNCKLIWDNLGPMTKNRAIQIIEESNETYVHEEGPQ